MPNLPSPANYVTSEVFHNGKLINSLLVARANVIEKMSMEEQNQGTEHPQDQRTDSICANHQLPSPAKKLAIPLTPSTPTACKSW